MTATHILLLSVLLALCVAGTPTATAHNAAILDCRENIVYTAADFLFGESDGTFWTEGYDTDGDGVMDVMAMSHMTGAAIVNGEVVITHDPNPLFWMVDYELVETKGGDTTYYYEVRDGEPDTVYIDKKGLGVCTDIVLYEDLRDPATKAPDFDTLPGGHI